MDGLTTFEPMLASTGRLPRAEDGWSFELKWDGVRALVYGASGAVRLRSRGGRDITGVYPELATLGEHVPAGATVLDGEIVAFDGRRPSFERLQERMNVGDERRALRLSATNPVAFVAFDLPVLDGADRRAAPLEERRAELAALALSGPHCSTSFVAPTHGPLLAIARANGYEGIVAKRLGSRYRSGRSPDWIKHKLVRRTSLVVGGWVGGDGGRSGRIGALCVGYREGDALRFAGKVGSGFSDAELNRLQTLLEGLTSESSPFTGRQPEAGARFVLPRLVCEVEFLEWTASRTLRAPVYKGLRADLEPAQARYEP